MATPREQGWLPAVAPWRWNFDAVVGTVFLALGGISFVAGFATSNLRIQRTIEARPAATPEELRAELHWFDRGRSLGGALALVGCGFLVLGALRNRSEGQGPRA